MLTLDQFRRRSLLLASALTLTLPACGGGPSFEKSLDEMWQWDGGVEASHVLKAVESADVMKPIPAAVGVTSRGLVGRTLPDGKLWNYEGAVDVLPTLVGDLVIFSGEGRVTALSVATGATKYSVKVNDRRLEGAGYDGQHSILLLVDSDDAREDQILVLGPQGNRVYSATANARLGTPAAVNGVGLVPYSGQYVGGLNLANGDHLGRVLVRDGLHTAKVSDGGVVLLGAGATRMNGTLTSSPDSRSLKLDEMELPGEPSWPIDGSKPRPARASPVGIYAFPKNSEGTLSFAGGGYVATYFEVVIGVDHGSNELRWATHFPRSIAGGAAGPYGPTLCLENGHLVRVNIKDGSHVPFGSLEAKVKACAVTASSEKIPTTQRPSVLEQLEDTISGTGPDMVAMQKVLLRELSASKTADTTKALLAISQNPLVSASLAQQAARLLRNRRKGGEEMIAALLASAPQPLEPVEKPSANGESPESTEKAEGDKPADEKEEKTPPPPAGDDTWTEPPEETTQKQKETPSTAPPLPAIESTAKRRESLRPPPVGQLANALTKMKTPGASTALALYLGDPSLSAKQFHHVMKAVLALGTGSPDEIRRVRTFLFQYKNTGGEVALVNALVLSVHFLFKYLSDEERAALKKDLDQSLTHPLLKKKLAKNPPPKKRRQRAKESSKKKNDNPSAEKASDTKK